MSCTRCHVDVFENPQRFRFNSVGKKIRELYDADLTGRFGDEIPPKIPLAFFIAQASVTIEARLPTFFSTSAATGSQHHDGYAAEFVANHLGQIDEKLGCLKEIANYLGQIDEKLGRHIEIMERKTAQILLEASLTRSTPSS